MDIFLVKGLSFDKNDDRLLLGNEIFFYRDCKSHYNKVIVFTRDLRVARFLIPLYLKNLKNRYTLKAIKPKSVKYIISTKENAQQKRDVKIHISF